MKSDLSTDSSADKEPTPGELQKFAALLDTTPEALEKSIAAKLDGDPEWPIWELRPCAEIHEAVEKLRGVVWYYRCYLPLLREHHDGSNEISVAKIGEMNVHARKVLGESGPLEPIDDVEWGIILGRYAALNWACGLEWDFMDT